jgi:putative Holliday junction resolvase
MSRLPRSGRLAGIDFGTVRIGIAICDPDQVLASPLESYERKGPEAERAHFCKLVEDERIAGFVVGLPVHASGDESQKSLEAREFGRWLEQTTGRPVEYYDERFTTVQAESLMAQGKLTRKRRKKRVDMLAAQLILSGYLESSRLENDRPPEL